MGIFLFVGPDRTALGLFLNDLMTGNAFLMTPSSCHRKMNPVCPVCSQDEKKEIQMYASRRRISIIMSHRKEYFKREKFNTNPMCGDKSSYIVVFTY